MPTETLCPFLKRVTLPEPIPKKQALKVGQECEGFPVVQICTDFMDNRMVVGYLLQTGYMGQIPKTT